MSDQGRGFRFGRKSSTNEATEKLSQNNIENQKENEVCRDEIAPISVAVDIQKSAKQNSDLQELREICLSRIDNAEASSMTPDKLFSALLSMIANIADELRLPVNNKEQAGLARDLVDDMTGLGPLQPLIEDQSISDIMVNGPQKVFVERYGKVEQVPGIRFRDSSHLTHICQRIAARVGRHVDEASPMVDARLQDGSRVNVVLPPLAIDGASLSIRKFRKQITGFEKLVEFGTMTMQIAKLMEIIARCRLNVIISGGTGSGKTTLMNAFSGYIEPSERIITVEDAAELQLQQPHVVRLETRPPSLEGKGEVTPRDLVRNALRMRPDRIIIGEVRGAEAFDMLQAMNTGHDGSMSTIHGNSSRDAIARIENMVGMANIGLSDVAIRAQIVSAVNIIVQIERQRDGKRRLIELTEVAGAEGGIPLLNQIASFVVDGDHSDGSVRGHYAVHPLRTSFHDRLVYFRLENAWRKAMESQ